MRNSDPGPCLSSRRAVRVAFALAASLGTPVMVRADPNRVATILAANRRAMEAAATRSPALRLSYRHVGHGLTGTTEEVVDAERGCFVVTRRTGAVVEQDGFDGNTPWARDRSGSVSDQAGGDMRPLAVSRIYREADGWWRRDRGRAVITYRGRRRSGGPLADVLSVTPAGGAAFEAWFDVHTHLLTRVEERRHGRTTVIRLSGYERRNGIRTAGRIVESAGDRSDDEMLVLHDATSLPVRSPATCVRPPWHPEDTGFAGGAERTVIPFRIIDGHIYGDVAVNGKGPLPFMFDTGGVNVLTPEAARSAGIGATGSLSMRGGGEGSVAGGIGVVQSLGIGGAILRDQRVMVVPMSDDDVHQAGMIGFETFRRLVTRIDYGHRTIELIKPSAFDPSGAGTPIPIAFYGNLPTVRATYGGTTGWFVVDTGIAASVFLTAPFTSSHGIRPPAGGGVRIIAGVGVGGPSYGSVFRGEPFGLGDLTVGRPVTILSSDAAGVMADPSLAGIIGSGILERYVVTLDYANSRMYLRSIVPAPSDLDHYDRSGMRLARALRGFRVVEVVRGGPAETAGLRRDDVVTTIDGRPAGSMSIDEARARLRAGTPLAQVPLIVARQGVTIRTTITLRELI